MTFPAHTIGSKTILQSFRLSEQCYSLPFFLFMFLIIDFSLLRKSREVDETQMGHVPNPFPELLPSAVSLVSECLLPWTKNSATQVRLVSVWRIDAVG